MSTGPAFELGHLVATPAALRFCGLHHVDMMELVRRHVRKDWGDLSDDDKLANDVALVDGARILSAYKFPQGKLWLITEAKDDSGRRGSTCVMLPSDY